MNKVIRTAFAVILIAALSVACGLLAQHFKNAYDLATHPKTYAEHVEKYAEIYGVPTHICYAVIKCESGFDSTAVSSAETSASPLIRIRFAASEFCFFAFSMIPKASSRDTSPRCSAT